MIFSNIQKNNLQYINEVYIFIFRWFHKKKIRIQFLSNILTNTYVCPIELIILNLKNCPFLLKNKLFDWQKSIHKHDVFSIEVMR